MKYCRDEVVEQMNTYVNRQYRKGTTHFSVFANESTVTVEVSCHNLNFKNYWGGEWLSTWTIDLSSQQIQGQIKVHNHYFEQGNIQFNLSKEVEWQKVALNGRKIVELITKEETNVI